MRLKNSAVLMAILAALCYGISAPASKILLNRIPPAFMAALLYLGAGTGMSAVYFLAGNRMEKMESKISRKDAPYIAGMIALDIAAPIFLMLGLSMTTPATVSLINNFEIAATAVIARLFFRESVGKRMWLAAALITISSILLSAEDFGTLSFSAGAMLVLLAGLCWGIENNCTRMLSLKNPLQIVVIKGLGSGCGSLAIAFMCFETVWDAEYILYALLLGFAAYGLSIFFYILAQRRLGAARTSAYYALAPFIGAATSFLVFRQDMPPLFFIALAVMILGCFLAAAERHAHPHRHTGLIHEHRHAHNDSHHNHSHSGPAPAEHSHLHRHEETEHTHVHTPDLHHSHVH